MQPIRSAMTSLRKALVAAFYKSLLSGKSLLQLMVFWVSPSGTAIKATTPATMKKIIPRRSPADFLKEAEELFLDPVGHDGLLEISAGLKAQFLDGLAKSEQSMLPSYSHQLPSGKEKGQYVAIDMGGTTLRVALIQLNGKDAPLGKQSEVVRINTFKVDRHAKSLVGMAFFDWLADRILETVSSSLKEHQSSGQPLGLSLAWSFPIE
jgi:hexokinase